jgi:hypothetical protein
MPLWGIVLALGRFVSISNLFIRTLSSNLPFLHRIPRRPAEDFESVAAPPTPSLWSW